MGITKELKRQKKEGGDRIEIEIADRIMTTEESDNYEESWSESRQNPIVSSKHRELDYVH